MSLSQILQNQQLKTLKLASKEEVTKYRGELLEFFRGLVDEECADLARGGIPELVDYVDMRKNLGFTLDHFSDAIYCMWIEDKLVGMGSVCRDSHRMINVYVAPKHRRKGYAREIVQCILDNEKIVDLTVIPNNPIVDLYKSMGFVTSLVTMFNTNQTK